MNEYYIGVLTNIEFMNEYDVDEHDCFEFTIHGFSHELLSSMNKSIPFSFDYKSVPNYSNIFEYIQHH